MVSWNIKDVSINIRISILTTYLQLGREIQALYEYIWTLLSIQDILALSIVRGLNKNDFYNKSNH